MARKRTNPRHVDGKKTGYTLNPDDSIELCPMYHESMDNSIAEEAAINKQLSIITAILHERLTACQKARAEFWKRIADDLGIDLEIGWNYRNGVVWPIPKTKGDTPK